MTVILQYLFYKSNISLQTVICCGYITAKRVVSLTRHNHNISQPVGSVNYMQRVYRLHVPRTSHLSMYPSLLYFTGII